MAISVSVLAQEVAKEQKTASTTPAKLETTPLAPIVAKKTVAAPAPEKAQAPQPVNPFPTGLFQITDYKYPVLFYAPSEYRPDRTYPLVIVAPSEGAKAQEGIAYLKGLADRRSVFILSTEGVAPQSGSTPYALDDWLIQIKKDIMKRFPINSKKIYLLGRDTGAHYAAYLAVKYPQEFTGAALIGAAWAGVYEKLILPSSNPEKQMPFFIVFRADQADVQKKNEVWLAKFQAKGYPLKYTEVKNADETGALEFKKDMFDWLDTTSQSWSATVAKSRTGFKSKFKQGLKDFFAV